MIKITSGIYNCPECNKPNDVNYNRGKKIIDGILQQTTRCYLCDSTYKIEGDYVYLLSKPIDKAQPIAPKKSKKDKIPVITYIIFSLLLLSAGFYIVDYLNKVENSVVATKVSAILPVNAEPNTSASTIITPRKPSNQQELNSVEQLKQNYKYEGKFTLGTDQQWHADNFSLTIDNDQIHYKKDGNTKDFDAVNKGIYTRQERGIPFKYQQYYLSNKGIYLLISHTKEILHNGTYYYRIIIDGQTQLAL
ncbi:hypothetical protein [Pedobacter panaciterrae]